MFPALRISHVVMPTGLTEDFLAVKRIVDPAAPTVEQNALAEFIRSGSYARHLKAMRRLYHRRSAALWEALRRHCGGRLDPAAETAGLQLHVRARVDAEEAELLHCALAHGVQVYPAGDCHLRAPSAAPELILGYGSVPEERIHEGVRRLSRALVDCA
jgi:GntR family transcriptional regulator/MocR family aminotransferase